MEYTKPLIVEPITTDFKSDNNPSQSWTPVVGEVTDRFLTSVVPQESREMMVESSVSILGKAISPNIASGMQTGLVVGYVQSGKTMSFETVATLAKDNGFRIVIVIAGISTALLEQSSGRLQSDLGLTNPELVRNWIMLTNPSSHDDEKLIQGSLDDWNDVYTPKEFRKTVLITVLKHHKRLSDLTDILGNMDLIESPVLIVDDEADQVSLNTEIDQKDGSATYRCLMKLRSTLPHHTYLQYTATPQAPLLINIIDSLSPNFVEVLEPGQNYVGGLDFFHGASKFVKIIPDEDIPKKDHELDGPPESLFDALRIFLVGVAIGLLSSWDKGNRSMLVHPSHRTEYHQTYYLWVESIFEAWKQILEENGSPDYDELINEFRDAYNELSKTADQHLIDFKEVEKVLPLAFRRTSVIEVNARLGKTPQVNWRNSYGWILVGGQAMDRGFTVEGLTVTYMPRGIGIGHADTLQQRARFFGYKRDYLGFCRIFIDDRSLRAFENYIEHEEYIREQLQHISLNNISLNDWKRIFILSPDLKPCRNQVLEYGYSRSGFSDEWIAPRYVYTSEDIVFSNQNTISNFISQLVFQKDEGDERRTKIQRHTVCKDVNLQKAIDELLLKIRISGTVDSERNTGMLLQLGIAVQENPDELCDVYIMSPMEKRRRSIGRGEDLSINAKSMISELFQGAYPVSPIEERGTIYPGDRLIRREDRVTIQIHELDIIRHKEVVAEKVPVIAVWMPERLAQNIIIQDQPNFGGHNAT